MTSPAPALAGGPAEGQPRRLSLWVCSISVFIVMLDGTIVTVALPRIGRDFDAGVSGLQWVTDGYLLVLACGLLGAGAAGDRLGRRRVFQCGLLLFGIGSIACSLAPGLATLVGFRMLQGLGAAMLVPASLSIIAVTFPDRKQRAAAMGTWGAISGLAVAAGPLLGGILVDTLGWRAIFWVNVPIVVLAVLLSRRYLTESRAPHPRRADAPGQTLAVAFLAMLTYALIDAPGAGWDSATTLTLFAGAMATLAGFIAVEHRSAEPLLDLGVFTDRAFAGAAVVAVLIFFAVNGFTFLTTLYLQDVRGDSPLIAGLSLLPATAIILVAAPLSGRLTGRYGPRWPAVAAAATMTAGLLLLTTVSAGESIAGLACTYVLVGVGLGLINAPVTTTAVNAMPASQAGVAAGVTGTARQVGGVLGVAVLGSMVTSHFRATATGTGPLRHTLSPTAADRFTDATHLGFAAAAAAAGLAALVSLLTLGHPHLPSQQNDCEQDPVEAPRQPGLPPP